METSRLTVRVPRDVLERAKRYARENRTTFFPSGLEGLSAILPRLSILLKSG